MDYPKQNEETQEEVPWWDKEPETEESREKLIDQIKAMKAAQKGVPRWMIFAQFFAILYVAFNLWFLYINMIHPFALYIGIYMIPLILVLFHYIIILRQLKIIAKGEKLG